MHLIPANFICFSFIFIDYSLRRKKTGRDGVQKTLFEIKSVWNKHKIRLYLVTVSCFHHKFQNELDKSRRKASLRRILAEVSIAKYRLGGAFFLSIFSSSIMMSIPYFTSFVIDHAVNGTIPISGLVQIRSIFRKNVGIS